MIIIPRVLTFVTVIVLACDAGAAAEVLRLTIEDAVHRAVGSNLELKASRKDLDLAQANQRRSNTWLPSNPYFSIGASGLAEGGGRGGSAGASSARPNLFAYLSQEIEIAGQRALRQDAARYGVDRELAGIRQAEVTLAATVKSAFVRALINRERQSAARRASDLTAEILRRTIAGTTLSTSTDRMDRNNARIQHLRFQRSAAAVEQSYQDGLDVLRRLLDVPFDEDIEPVGSPRVDLPPLPPLATLVDSAFRQRPDLQAFERAKKGAEAQVSVIRRERIPNITLSGSYSRFDSDDFAGGDLGMQLPLFQTRDADLIEAAAERDRAAIQEKDLYREVEREVREMRGAYELASADLATYRDTILPLAEENVELNRRLLVKDEVNEVDVINQQLEALGVRREYLDVLERANIALFELERAIGGPLDAVGSVTPTASPTPLP
jgi:cobalt-zinc-cadmium efflux system outer membrane protein